MTLKQLTYAFTFHIFNSFFIAIDHSWLSRCVFVAKGWFQDNVAVSFKFVDKCIYNEKLVFGQWFLRQVEL